MSDTPATPPCCAVGPRPDAADILAALRCAQRKDPGAESLNAIHRRTGIRKADLIKHRDECSVGGSEPGRTGSRHDEPPIAASQISTPPADEPRVEPDPPKKPSPWSVPNPGDDPVTAPRKLVTVKVEKQAVKLRLRGKSYEDIADAIGISEGAAEDAVERAMIRDRRKTNQMVDALRELELRRLDALIESLWDRATDPAMAECEVPADTETGVRKYDGQDKAVANIAKLMERRAKLAGIDAPTAPLVQINVLQDPAVLAQQRVQAAILDHLFPGVAQALADGFQAYQTTGTDGLRRFIEDQLRSRDAITVEAQPLDATDHEDRPR